MLQTESSRGTNREAVDVSVAEGDSNKIEEHAAERRDCEKQPKGSAALAGVVHLCQNGLDTRHHQRQSNL